MKATNKNIDLKSFKVNDGFFSPIRKLVKDVVLPYQHDILEDNVEGAAKSHAIENFRIAAGDENGTFYGMVFQDSDVAKWIEACAYSLALYPDAKLEKTVDDIIDIIGRAQLDDGYLNTYFTVKEPEHKWQNLHECHELYCAGHMIEAAVAYYEATGKDKLLNIMIRMSDLMYKVFITDKNPELAGAIPGHPEIELALMRLYHLTGNDKYLELTKLFIDNRGNEPNFFETETKRRGWEHFHMNYNDKEYAQNHLPVRKQTKAAGHAVRAVYLYTGMADLAGATDEKELFDACETLFDNIAEKQSYITGAIGSTHHGEAFTTDYDLPNDTIYAETCAAIGLIFFADKMLTLKPSGKYADLMERALYNGVLSGMQLDGSRFFYVNPLEVNPGISGVYGNYRHVLPERPKWFGCACCPPNVSRLLTSLGKYVIHHNDDTIYSNLFVGGKADIPLASGNVTLTVTTDYPTGGVVKYTFDEVSDSEITLAIRIPWFTYDEDGKTSCVLTHNGKTLDVNNITNDGYAYISDIFKSGDEIILSMELTPVKMYANTSVRYDVNNVAIMRGPIVYCFEGADNTDGALQEYGITADAKIKEGAPMDIIPGTTVIPLIIDGYTKKLSGKLYSTVAPVTTPATLTAIPYYTWGNRGLNQMRVWMHLF
ncbi:MAG: glycoside hydrolase family 127 protein [Lachnospiraceae bacterium]|nr:glycoside hydrolase family 127 protein [Lachnospiraceae bacterium]